MADTKLNHRERFERERARFANAVGMAVAVSKLAGGRMPKAPAVMASFVFTRMCVAAETMRYVLQRDIGESKELTLDHYSIGVISRNIVEAALVFHYLSEDGVSDEEWELRRRVLDLHDIILKLRLFKSMGANDQYDGFKELMTKTREEMKNNAVFKLVDAERQQKLLSGHELYVRGMRSTLKLLDFDESYFDGMYTYLSSQVHVAPSSFYFTHERLNFGEPADYQYYFATYALAHARIFFLKSAIRLANSDDAVRQKVDPAMHQSMIELEKIRFGE